MESNDKKVKITFIGPEKSGKSSIVNRFSFDSFNPEQNVKIS